MKTDRFAAVSWLRTQYDIDAKHSQQVADLAMQLFDQLASIHHLGAAERELLLAAALLHDIGQYLGLQGHHKSSKKLIMQNNLDGWDKREKRIIALVARYHRKAIPSSHHKSYRKLLKKDQLIVNKLAALLRIADGLDRSRQTAITKTTCVIGSKKIQLDIQSSVDIGLELYGFHKKRDYFIQTFKRDIIINHL